VNNLEKQTYTIAIVDEGLLDLTRFKAKCLGQFFMFVKLWA
jgi:uncharacterized protein YfaS (alpha-2-macroglobulin family)